MPDKDYIFIHIPKTAGRSILSVLGEKILYRHKTIADYGKHFSENEMRRKFKFTCVRNPWDRAVSCWAFFGNMGLDRVPFDQWLKKVGNRPKYNQYQKFLLDQMSFCRTPSGEVLIDSFLRFEHLDADWIPVARRLGISEKLPTIGKQDRQMQIRMRESMLRSKRPELAPMIPTDNYRDMYTSQETIDLVGRLDSETVKRFGYTFK